MCRNVSYILTSPLLSKNTEAVGQAISHRKLFEDGSLLLTHGKIITSLRDLGTRRLRRGSFEATLSQNGNHLNRVRCYGSTGSVSCCAAITLFPRLMNVTFCSGRREECILVR